jgi:N-acetylglutamate synthase-like GNAT family acetyltransferase
MSYVLLGLREPADWADFHAIRRVELFEARGRFGVYDENHPHDRADFAHPFLLRKDGRALGAVRLDLFGEGRAAVRLVAITAAEQGRGHGRVMEAMVTEKARAMGVHTLLVNANGSAVGFYEKTGWSPFAWDPSELEGDVAPCIQMRKLL